MQPDDEAPLTLSKWPFYLGDALLVVTALAIAILGKWQLTDMQVISCVIAVALGAVIFGLPYVVEYSMRVREEKDDRASELHLLKKHWPKAEAGLLQCHERLNKLESGSGSVDQRCELLASAVDQKLNQASQASATLSQQVAAIESRLLVLEESAQAAIEAAAAVAEAPAPARAPRSRRSKADSGLLQRAIEEKQDSASSAVSRIIDSKSKLAKSGPELTETTEMPEEPIPQVAAPKESVLEVTETQELAVEHDPIDASEAIEEVPKESEFPIGADLIKNDELQETEASEADAPVDLFGEVEPAAIRQPRTKANDAVFTASILIGIGNKPFLRGSAGGLSWQIGLPMDFEEIGKWRWVAPADLAGPVELQIYRNDEDPDRNGRHTLDPGQKLEVTPIF